MFYVFVMDLFRTIKQFMLSRAIINMNKYLRLTDSVVYHSSIRETTLRTELDSHNYDLA